MASVPGPLMWEIVKHHNSLAKGFANSTAILQFSREPNNLFNVQSFKYSELSNKKTVTIQPAGKDMSVVLGTTKTKKQNKTASLVHRSVMKKELHKMAKAVVNKVADNRYRPDLKDAVLARLSSVYRSLQVKKSGPKKKNRQAVNIKVPRKRMFDACGLSSSETVLLEL